MTQDARELHDRLRKEDQSFMSDFEMTVVETSNPALRRWALPEKRRVTITRVDDVRGIQTELLDPGIPKYIKNAESIDYDDDEHLLLWRHSEHRGYKDAEYSGHWRALVLYRIAPDDKVTEAQSPHRTVDLWRPGGHDYRHLIYPVWGAGRGFADHFQEILSVTTKKDGLIELVARGSFRAVKEGTWTVTLDPKTGYAARRAEFRRNSTGVRDARRVLCIPDAAFFVTGSLYVELPY